MRRAAIDPGPPRAAALLSALGVRVEVAADRPDRLAALLDRVPNNWIRDQVDRRTPAPPVTCRLHWRSRSPHIRSRPAPAHHLLLNGKPTVTTRRAGDLLDRFEHELLAAVVARTSLVVLHAGAVAHRGRAILLPGFSFSGKSTLVRALVAAGATYYSDDVAAIDAFGRLHAVPKRLALRQGARRVETIDADQLGWEPSCEPREVAAIILCRYRPGIVFAARRLSPGEGVLALFRHTMSADAAADRALRVLAELTVKTRVLIVADRGDAKRVAATILATVSRP